jgi:prophage antirepressor-like protein
VYAFAQSLRKLQHKAVNRTRKLSGIFLPVSFLSVYAFSGIMRLLVRCGVTYLNKHRCVFVAVSKLLTSLFGGFILENKTQRKITMTTLVNSAINPFQFDSLEVRTFLDENNNPWFCAVDVCTVLDIAWRGLETLKNMPENWLMVRNLRTIQGERETYFINEAGLYNLVFRSNKPNAKEFANWVCEVVLPSIRKFGGFGTVKPRDYLAVIRQINTLTRQVIQSKNAFFVQTTLPQLHTLHRMIGSKMPDLKLVTAELEQDDLFVGGAK